MRARLVVAAVSLAIMLLLPSSASSVVGIAKFRERQISHRIIGQGAGRIEVWRTRVYTLPGKFVGTGVMTCIYVDHHSSHRHCTGSYLLPLGTVIVSGSFTFRAAFEIFVLTGDRFYEDTNGTMIVRRFAKVPPQSFITFYFSG
jgi:hypothetical protein